MNINIYDLEICKAVVEKYDIENILLSKFGYRRWDYSYSTLLIDHPQRTTPREHMVHPMINLCSFYYLKYLLDKNPQQIVDIGCGMNFYKNIFPQIHGIDWAGNYYDEEDIFDDNFVSGHKNFYESAFSIDALHLIPLDDFRQRVLDFHAIIKPGGRGYLALNVARIIDNSVPKSLTDKFHVGWLKEKEKILQNYILEEINSLPIKFLVIDCLIDKVYDEYLDGNIRLVFEK